MTLLNTLKPVTNDPLVSVVITTYNHSLYLPDSIESVLDQTYPYIELIVVDDGSTDNTAEVITTFKNAEIKYIYQNNKGLAAARNAGAFNSKGEYIVFLDADDILYPQAVAQNLKFFKLNPKCAFISGGHDIINENKQLIDTDEWQQFPDKEHYLALLSCDYISMHAAVMYRREIFDHYHYDETLPACEDYDFYLQIAKNYPVFSHNQKIAAYRKHEKNMSGNAILMYRSAIKVLRKNYDHQADRQHRMSYQEGKKSIKDHYSGEMYRYLKTGNVKNKYNLRKLVSVISVLPWKYKKRLLYEAIKTGCKKLIKKVFYTISSIKRIFGGGSKTIIPKPGNIRMGDLRRTRPFSINFGYDRGGPVDRYYIENFLKENADDIKGRVLEIGDNFYTRTFGGERVKKSDILHVDQTNPQATITGDLSHADHIPAEQFDCIVLTQTLHLIFDFKSALKHCYRILKHGGTLLLTVPGITPIDHGQWKDTWYWSFTGKSIQKLLSEHFDPLNIQVQTHGNVLAATAFLYGMGHKEISAKEIVQNDSHYQVIIAAKATKN